MCKGEPCNIIEYSFNWEKALIVEASGTMRKRSDGEVLDDPNILDEVKKHFEQHPIPMEKTLQLKSDQSKDLAVRFRYENGACTLTNAACGAEGKCICIPVVEGTVVELGTAKRRFRITNLDGTTAKISKGDYDCATFTLVIEVEVTIRVIEGRCLPTEGGEF